MAHNNNEQNLIPLNKRTKEEQREIQIAGGIASGEARRQKATMKATLEKLLDEKSSKGQTYRELATLGLLKGAVQGKVENYKLILEMMGEVGSYSNNEINDNIQNIADLINNPKANRGEDDV